MLLLSILSIILANILFYFGPAVFLPEQDMQAQYNLFSAFVPSRADTTGYLNSAVFCLGVLGVILLVSQIPQAVRYRAERRIWILALILVMVSLPLARPASDGFRFMAYAFKSVNAAPMTGEPSLWTQAYFEGLDLRIPEELKQTVSGGMDPHEAYSRGLPFAYQGFAPRSYLNAPWLFERFELRLGVHRNEEKLSAEEYLKRKNLQLQRSGRTLSVFLIRDVAVGNLKGLEDNVTVTGPEGRLTLDRVIIPYKDKFFMISAVIGRDQIIPQYKTIFDSVIASLAVDRRNPPKPLKERKPARAAKIHLEEF